MGDAALDGAAQAVDAVVGLLGGQALQGLQDILVLLDDQVIGTVAKIKKQLVSISLILLTGNTPANQLDSLQPKSVFFKILAFQLAGSLN